MSSSPFFRGNFEYVPDFAIVPAFNIKLKTIPPTTLIILLLSYKKRNIIHAFSFPGIKIKVPSNLYPINVVAGLVSMYLLIECYQQRKGRANDVDENTIYLERVLISMNNIGRVSCPFLNGNEYKAHIRS